MSNFEIEIKGLDKLEGAIKSSPKMVHGELSRAIKTSVNMIRTIMRGEAPNKSGKLSRNIYAKAKGLEGEVGPNLDITPYARWVHDGTDPYIIRPKNKEALYWKGALHPVRLVHHPGLTANPFVERTASQMRRPVQEIFRKTIARIISNIHQG